LDDTYTPSLDFIKWAKTALTGLRTPVDEFLQICLSFPIDPPGAAKAEGAEIIAEMVYANSATLDGRRFANDFFEKRKQDAKKQAADKVAQSKGGWTTMGSASATQTNLADVVKSVQSKKEDTGFKVVKAKGKKK
jgi:PERQ amino acid-rich with GYF domain-containing protein